MEHKIYFDKKFYLDKTSGYWVSTTLPKIRAHVWVWEYYNGKVLKDHHIHHINGIKSDNRIENLQMLHRSEHIKLHVTPESRNRSRELAAIIRPLTKAWHASEEGRKWHREHALKNNFGKWPELDYQCQQCGKNYKSKLKNKNRTRFCSNNCKSQYRRDQKIDDIEIVCEHCNKSFMRNKYEKSRFCGYSCSKKDYWIKSKNNKAITE